jgi:hypothetical protein
MLFFKLALTKRGGVVHFEKRILSQQDFIILSGNQDLLENYGGGNNDL